MPMVRSTHQGPDGLLSLENLKGGKQLYTHIQNVDDIAQQCYEDRKDPGRGFNKGKTMQRIASIPELVFFARPELVTPDGRVNEAELRKFLNSPEGELFKTTETRI